MMNAGRIFSLRRTGRTARNPARAEFAPTAPCLHGVVQVALWSTIQIIVGLIKPILHRNGRGGIPTGFADRNPRPLRPSFTSAVRSVIRRRGKPGVSPAVRSAFTLIELLVVIAIIALLIGILLPALLLAQKNGYISATESTMSSISIGLEQYHTDFNMYPPSSATRYTGSSTPTPPLLYTAGGEFPIPAGAAYDYLAEALLGYEPGNNGNGAYGDGAGAPYTGTRAGIQAYKGFSMSGSPQVYGPYVSLTASSITPDAASPGCYYFGDSFPPQSAAAMPILYYTPDMTPAPVGTTIMNYTSPTTADDIFNAADDSAAPGGASGFTQTDTAFLALLGATNTSGATPNLTEQGQTILGSNTFLLVSAGPDGKFFTGDDIVQSGRQ